MVGSNVDYYIW